MERSYPGAPGETGTETALASPREPRARPPLRPQAAVQVLGARPCRLLGHRRTGHRLLRPVSPLLRPRARRVPPPPWDGVSGPRARVRHARARSTTSRRPVSTTSSRRSPRVAIGRTSVTYECAAFRLKDDVQMVTAHQTLVLVELATHTACAGARIVPRDDSRVRGRRPRGVSMPPFGVQTSLQIGQFP